MHDSSCMSRGSADLVSEEGRKFSAVWRDDHKFELGDLIDKCYCVYDIEKCENADSDENRREGNKRCVKSHEMSARPDPIALMSVH